jgi:hypothetical protein
MYNFLILAWEGLAMTDEMYSNPDEDRKEVDRLMDELEASYERIKAICRAIGGRNADSIEKFDMSNDFTGW